MSFRNILAHGYDRIVWEIIEEDLDKLRLDIEKLMADRIRPSRL